MGLINFSLHHREPLFGLDIGHSSLKVMQLGLGNAKDKKPTVVGYGTSYRYAVSSIQDGVIVDYKALSDAMHDLFDKRLVGIISTRKVACTIPMSHSFSRPLKLPAMQEEDLDEAVHLEAEQYIPVAPDKLYIDYDVVRRDEKNIELLVVATPKNIIESYMKFLESMALEPVALEPTMNATARIFGLADPGHGAPTVLVDFGANATDIAVFDKDLFVNSTVQGGSDTLINLIAKKLDISREEAYAIKNQEGIGFSDQLREIGTAVKPILDNLVREIQKITRYYDERIAVGGRKITQVITIGGGANMPGLSEYLSKELGMPVRLLDPWNRIDFGPLAQPNELERSMFITVAGEAVLDISEILRD
ncbi:MAG TPA: type IV pilus assembly protein PilM [Candidatus Saccharimonadales bacterium]|nr:type IV pilus assembly protein PilM [Candidatus Saccharimonadales bacterium]